LCDVQLECFPPFIVEIEKEGIDKMLTFHCVHMPACEMPPPENSLNKDFGKFILTKHLRLSFEALEVRHGIICYSYIVILIIVV